MRGGTNISAAAHMIGAWNDTAAVDNGLIHKTVDPSQSKTTDKLQNLGSTDLIRGRSNNTAAVSKISCPVIDMIHYSFENQLDGKQRKIECMGIRYNCTGTGKSKGKNITVHGDQINRRGHRNGENRGGGGKSEEREGW